MKKHKPLVQMNENIALSRIRRALSPEGATGGPDPAYINMKYEWLLEMLAHNLCNMRSLPIAGMDNG